MKVWFLQYITYNGNIFESTPTVIEYSKIKNIKLESNTIGYRIHSREKIMIDDIVVLSHPTNIETYYKGKEYTLAGIIKEFPNELELIDCMKSLNLKAVLLENGELRPLYENEYVIK